MAILIRRCWRLYFVPTASFSSTPIRRIIAPPPDAKLRLFDDHAKEIFLKILGNTTGELRPLKELIGKRLELFPFVPKSVEEMKPRRMADSYREALIPLRDDHRIRSTFRTSHNMIRVGRLLEKLDIFAAGLSYHHLHFEDDRLNKTTPYFISTVRVEETNVEVGIPIDSNVRLSGHVSWVGTSSLEVAIVVDHQGENEDWIKTITTHFIMVVKEATMQGKAFFNPLIVETNEEKNIFEQGERRNIARTKARKMSLFVSKPLPQEVETIHGFFDELREHSLTRQPPFAKEVAIAPYNYYWMEDAKYRHTYMCHTENANLFLNVFGGFLMRLAMELGWATAFVYSQRRPRCLYISVIEFKSPVRVADVLSVKSQVCYTQGNLIQVRVTISVIDPQREERKLTDSLHYTFEVDGEESVPKVFPKSYKEAITYLVGKRKFEHACNMGRFKAEMFHGNEAFLPPILPFDKKF